MKRFLAIVLILTSMLALCACTPKQEAKFLGTWTDDLGNNVLILEKDGSVYKATFNDGTVYNWEMAPQPEMDYGQPKYEVLYDTINFFEYEDRSSASVVVDPTQPAEEVEATEAPDAAEGEETTEATEATEAVEEETEATEATEAVEEETEATEATEAAEGEEAEATEPAEETEAPEATEAPKPAPTADEEEKTPVLTAKLVIKNGKMMLILSDMTGKELCLYYKTAVAAK